jgi:hypothetical protein
MLKDALGWLHDQLFEVNVRWVLYKRRQRAVLVKAVVGRSTVAVDELDGVRREFTDRDYLIRAADLVFAANERVTPEVGDVIEDANDERTVIYEVLTAAQEGVWRWSDVHRDVYRIHVKQVE